jgi:E3 ubiquitin-protein ligase BRE1
MVQKNLDEMREKLAKTEERWAQSLGNEKAAVTAVEELIAKFNKRWAEVANQNGMATSTSMTSATEDDSVQAGSVDDEKIIASLPEDPQIVQAREIAELEHKLSQALENVRQSETTKDNLKVALEMNQTLQSKLEEIKTKYAALQEAKSGSTSHHSATDRTTKNEQVDGQVSGAPSSSSREKEGTTADADHHKPFTEGSGSGSRERSVEKTEKLEKLAMQFRRAKKELLAAQASKDRAKALLERAERERQSMMESNVRLISQIAEKDEMNAKSLSTILHLKSLTEKLSAEKEILEQQAKSSSQLALAARLATNAKERVSEELMKEKQTLEEQFSELEKQYMSTKTELEKMFAEWSEASGKMKTKESALANALQRCEELAAENEQKREEIRKLVDILSKTEKEATDAKERLSDAIKSGAAMGGDSTSGAYVDQLKTQVSVLKSRLACPVCHYRDKECIILRCRHMHCKQCVEERISNRSRKCPTCNVKFSENDVGDIWLN